MPEVRIRYLQPVCRSIHSYKVCASRRLVADWRAGLSTIFATPYVGQFRSPRRIQKKSELVYVRTQMTSWRFDASISLCRRCAVRAQVDENSNRCTDSQAYRYLAQTSDCMSYTRRKKLGTRSEYSETGVYFLGKACQWIGAFLPVQPNCTL